MSLRGGIFKLRTVIHKTPGVNVIAKTYASAFGLGSAWDKFDKRINVSESGDPVPDSPGGASFSTSGDIAAYVGENYPAAYALVSKYREQQGRFQDFKGRVRGGPGVIREPEPEQMDDEEDYGDDDDEEE